MKRKVIASSTADRTNTRQAHVATFAKAKDGRKQPIRGLWILNDRFYPPLTVGKPIEIDAPGLNALISFHLGLRRGCSRASRSPHDATHETCTALA